LPDQNKDPEWSKFIRRLFQKAEPYLAVRGDMAHAQVSHDYALILIRQEGGNASIVEPAIILHDVGWSCLKPREISIAYGVRPEGEETDRLNRIHEAEGASIARQILQTLDYDLYLIDKIASIIQRHDSGNDAHTLEEKLVKDADKLWRFSKIGFWEEIERQGLNPNELYEHLAERYEKWLFTSTALALGGEELEKRGREIDFQGRRLSKR
jgi:HD superfamily phosphodiesterase